jgi:hypothetical protein
MEEGTAPDRAQTNAVEFNLAEMLPEGKRSFGWLRFGKTQSFDSLRSIVVHEAWCS